MADQREQPLEPIVSGSSPADVSDLYEADHDASDRQREVDHLFDEDSDDGTEQHAEPPHIDTDNAPQNVSDDASQPGVALSPNSIGDTEEKVEPLHVDSDNALSNVSDNASHPESAFSPDSTGDTEEHVAPLHVDTDIALQNVSDSTSQPGSAFSPDSSDEDDDADDEAEGEDSDAESHQADEWEGFSDSNVPYSPPPVPLPAVRGIFYRFNNDYTLYKGSPKDRILYHSEPDTTSKTTRNKRKAHDEAKNRIVRPSRLRTTSSPDSPESPKNKQSNDQFGVPPGSNPQTEDQHVVSPLQERDELARPKSALGHRRSSTWDWSEEEDDDDDSEWLKNAIKDIKTPRRKSEGSLSEDLPSGSNVQVYLAGNAEVPVTPDHDAEPGGDNAVPPEDPVSPLSPVDSSDQPDAVSDTANQSSHDSELPASLRVGTSESNIGDGAIASPQVDQETHLPTPTAPEGFNPVFDNAHARSQVPISPDPDGPETLTGLTPQEGIDTWWEFHDRSQPRPFRTNRNPNVQDETGDLTPMDDSRDREDAADFLSKQRFLLKQQEPEITVECTSDDHKKTQEQLTIQMLKYRFQRNQFWYDNRESEARVQRRDQWVRVAQDRITESEQKIAALTHDLGLTEDQFCVAKMQSEKLEKENKKLGYELGDCHGHARELRSQVEDLSERLKESQESCANHDEICTELRVKIAELEDKVVAVETDESHKAIESQLQAEAETLRRQLRKKNGLEVELAACRAHNEQLQSRKDELEVELEALMMTQQANDSSASDLSNRVQAAEELARDRQAIIDDLEVQLSARDSELSNAHVASSEANEKYRDLEADKNELREDLDESNAANATLQDDLDATRREVEILKEEVRLHREALLEHNKRPSSPLPESSTRPMSDRGTQTDNTAPVITIQEPQTASLSPVRLPQPREVPAEASQESISWANRRRAIMRQQSAVEELESRRTARELRQAEELKRLEQIRQRVAVSLRMDKSSSVPVEARSSGIAV